MEYINRLLLGKKKIKPQKNIASSTFWGQVVAQQSKLQPAMLASHGVLVQVVPLQFQSREANVFCKSVHMGDLDVVPVSLLQPSLALTVGTFWKVNQQTGKCAVSALQITRYTYAYF